MPLSAQVLTAEERAFVATLPVVRAALPQAAKNREVDIVMTIGVTTERLRYLEFTVGATPRPGALFSRSGMSGED